MAPTFFRILLALIALYVLLYGRRDERHVGIVLVVGVIATHLVISPLRNRFATVETHVMIVDIIVFGGFLWIALRSDRFWPLWIAGLQLTTIFGHILKSLDSDLFFKAYAASMVFWGYPIMFILAVGTWRNHRRWLRHERTAPI
jgi:hypothetical protein